jgi:hypothetical protein
MMKKGTSVLFFGFSGNSVVTLGMKREWPRSSGALPRTPAAFSGKTSDIAVRAGAEKISMMSPWKKAAARPDGALEYAAGGCTSVRTHAALFILSVHGVFESGLPHTMTQW